MTTYNTGNPIGSTDSRDRLDNTENMDYLENSTTELTHPDRLGTVRKTRYGMEVEHDAQISAHETEHDNQIAAHESEHDAQMQAFDSDFDDRLAGMAFTRVGSFTAGATLTDMRQVLVWEVSQGGDGHEYGWAGAFPKVVAAGATPSTSGGIGAGTWVDRTDVTLRDEIVPYSDIVYKSKGFVSALSLMLADTRSPGTICQTEGMLWERLSTGDGSTISDYRPLTPLTAYNESDILLLRKLYDSASLKTYVWDKTITFNQDFSYPVDHLEGNGKLNWNGRIFDIAKATDRVKNKTLGFYTGKMNAGVTVRIGCIGDSTTDGYPTAGFVDNPYTTGSDGKKYPASNTNHSDVGAPNAWPTKMRTMLRDYHGNDNIQVYNGGYGGQSLNVYTPSGKSYKTSWPYRYFERIFFENNNYGNVDLVFISFGLNGAVSTDSNRVDDMIRGLELLVYKIKGYGAVPVILTPDAVLGKSPTNYQTKSREEFCQAFIEFASANSVNYFDVWTAERKFWANNNIYKFRQNMTDGVHQKDSGHQFKAGFLAHNFMGAVVKLEQNMESVFLNEREAHHAFLNNGQASSGNLRYGGFSVFNVNNRAQASTWVWCESADYDVVMRDFGIQYDSFPTALADLPSINVTNAVGYDTGAYLNKTNSHGGRTAAHVFPAETPNIIGKLRYGLNRIDNVGPLGSNVSGAYLGYLQFIRDLRNSSRELFANQIGSQRERVYLPSQAWMYNPVESGISKIYMPAAEDWVSRNLVNWANAGDVVTLYLELNMTQDVGLPICDGQTDVGRSGIILYQTSTGYSLYEHRRLDDGTINFVALGVVTTAHPPVTDNKVKLRLTASSDGLDQTIQVFNGWDDSTPNSTIQRSVIRPSGGAFRSAGVIGGLWSGNGQPTTAVSVKIKQCLIEKGFLS